MTYYFKCMATTCVKVLFRSFKILDSMKEGMSVSQDVEYKYIHFNSEQQLNTSYRNVLRIRIRKTNKIENDCFTAVST